MNVQSLEVEPGAALVALNEYRQHRERLDKTDREIMRIYRAIAKGKAVICAQEAIRQAGVDELGRPRLAIMRADQEVCRCSAWRTDTVTFTNIHGSKAAEWHFEIPWPNRAPVTGTNRYLDLEALLPRIPPQFRPEPSALPSYHLLWEAEWRDVPRDPYLLKRIGEDAWVVVAGWELTDVEIAVLRARRRRS